MRLTHRTKVIPSTENWTSYYDKRGKEFVTIQLNKNDKNLEVANTENIRQIASQDVTVIVATQ